MSDKPSASHTRKPRPGKTSPGMKPKKQPPVALFVGPGCKWCAHAKKYLKNHGIKFRTIDITKDKQAEKDCWKHGCRGIPVVLIGSRWICGFDQKTIDKLLDIK